MASQIQAAAHDVCVRGLAETLSEGAGKVCCAEPDHFAEVRDMDRLGQVFLDKRFDPADLPWRESSRSRTRVGRVISAGFHLKQ